MVKEEWMEKEEGKRKKERKKERSKICLSGSVLVGFNGPCLLLCLGRGAKDESPAIQFLAVRQTLNT